MEVICTPHGKTKRIIEKVIVDNNKSKVIVLCRSQLARDNFIIMLKTALFSNNIPKKIKVLSPMDTINYQVPKQYHLYIDDIDRIVKIYRSNFLVLGNIKKFIEKSSYLTITTTKQLSNLFIP
jgi:hypothetical protein